MRIQPPRDWRSQELGWRQTNHRVIWLINMHYFDYIVYPYDVSAFVIL